MRDVRLSPAGTMRESQELTFRTPFSISFCFDPLETRAPILPRHLSSP